MIDDGESVSELTVIFKMTVSVAFAAVLYSS